MVLLFCAVKNARVFYGAYAFPDAQPILLNHYRTVEAVL